MVGFRYKILNTLYQGGGDDADYGNNNNNNNNIILRIPFY
jgi:hypothetical protein